MKLKLSLTTLAVLCTMACTSDNDEPVATTEATVQITLPSWHNATTRAGNGALYPINVLLVPKDRTDIARQVTVVSGTQFGISIPDGEYDFYAVCGLPTKNIPSDITHNVVIPDDDNGGKIDFAVGSTSVTAKGGVCTPAIVNIQAARQTAWLDITIKDVPSNITALRLFVKGLYDTYTLENNTWTITAANANRFTEIPIAQNATTPSSYEGNLLTVPSASDVVTYYLETMTSTGYGSSLEYTSQAPLSAGTHLTEVIAYDDLTVADGDVQTDAWDEVSDNGTFKHGTAFKCGEQYFGHAATVYHLTSTQYFLFPHEPIVATLDEVRSWSDYMQVPYTAITIPSVSSWALPLNATPPSNLNNYLKNRLNSFNAMIQSTGHTALDQQTTNILAYYNKTTDTFYRYDFENFTIVPVESTDTRQFLIYPTGIVKRAQ